MPIKIEMLIQDDGKDGVSFDYESNPVDKVTEIEEDVASAIMVLCNLIDDDEFNRQVSDFIRNRMLKIRSQNDVIL